MKLPIKINFFIIAVYFILSTSIGNIYFPKPWELVCEILEILNLCLILFVSIKIYTSSSKQEQVVFRWFIISNTSLFISAISYFSVTYILNIKNIGMLATLNYFIPPV